MDGLVVTTGVLATAMSRAMKCFLHDFYDKIPTENLWISTFSVWVEEENQENEDACRLIRLIMTHHHTSHTQAY